MHGARALPWELCFPAGSVCSGLPGAPGWPRLPVWAPCGLRPRWPAPSPAPCGWVQPLRPRCPHRGWGGEAFRTRPRLPLGSFHPGLSCGRLLLAPGAQARAPRRSQGPRSHGAPAILCPGLAPFSLSSHPRPPGKSPHTRWCRTTPTCYPTASWGSSSARAPGACSGSCRPAPECRPGLRSRPSPGTSSGLWLLAELSP